MKNKKIIIGSRGSKLAMIYAEKAKNELGNRFDIKDFHSVVLMNGVLPLTVLEALINDYIADNS